MRVPSLPFVLATLAALAGCSLTDREPLPPGTFEVEVTGDIEASGSGTAWVAEPDSSLDVSREEWTVRIPVAFATSEGDSVRVSFYVSEPTEPTNRLYTELPEGTFPIQVSRSDFERPFARAAVTVAGEFLDGVDGRATLRRRSDGSVEGEVSTRYAGLGDWGPGQSERGRFDLRFTALAEPPPP